MSEIIFESNTGLVFEKADYKNGRCKMTVRSKEPPGHIMTYRYKNVPVYQSPYISWENLNCCGGWGFDETYLYTAVQRGKKPFSAITFSMYDDDFIKQVPQHNLMSEKDVGRIIEKLKADLPGNCVLGEDEPYRTQSPCSLRYIFICRDCSMKDMIDVSEVLLSYERLGIIIDDYSKSMIISLCEVPLQLFATTANPPFHYAHPRNGFELAFVGLLLGYPIESTAWLLERDEYFPIEK